MSAKSAVIWRKLHPWARHVEWANRRCTDSECKSYKSHGARGIEVHLNAKEAGMLWTRDNAEAMKKPTLDRKDSGGHYTYNNCRFIEHALNSRLPHDPALQELDKGYPALWDDVEQEASFV